MKFGGNFYFNLRYCGFKTLSDLRLLQPLRTFALIVSAYPFCARKFACHIIHERALSNKINK